MKPQKLTACGVPKLLDPNSLRDDHAERVVLRGLLFDPAELAPQLRAMGFTKGDFYWNCHQSLYTLALYCHNGGVDGPLLADVYAEGLRRRPRELCDSLDAMSFCLWLVDVWEVCEWTSEAERWCDRDYDLTIDSYTTWCALAAAAKVQHLRARRAAMHAANEVIRDTLSPTGSAEEITDRTGNVLGEEYG